jgi:MFS superfamily sulfate permease-like transporter
VRQVILDARAIPGIDLTAAEQLRDYVERLRERGITLVIAKAHLPLREMLGKLESDLLDGREQFGQLADAVATFQAEAPVRKPRKDEEPSN